MGQGMRAQAPTSLFIHSSRALIEVYSILSFCLMSSDAKEHIRDNL